MILLLAALLQQAPTLTAAASQEFPKVEWTAMAVSPTGRYLVLGSLGRLQIRDAKSLDHVKDLELDWTAFRFDEEEGRLLVIGDRATRVLVKDWSVQFQVPIPESRFAANLKKGKPNRPGQAFILPDLDFYYVNAQGGISLASVADGKLEPKGENLASEEPLERILTVASTAMIVASREGMCKIAYRGKVYGLVGAINPLAAAALPNLAVVVGTQGEALYSTTSWKVILARSGQTNHCAALDPKSGWVFVGDSAGLRGWSLGKVDAAQRYEQLPKPVLQAAVAPDARALYTLEKTALRRWTISD